MKFVYTTLALIFIYSHAYGAFTAAEKALLNYPNFKIVRLSPDGSKVAISFVKEEQESIVVLNRKTMKPYSGTAMDKNYHIGNILWIDNKRILLSVAYSVGYLKKDTFSKSYIYSLNFDGTGKKQIFPTFSKRGLSAPKSSSSSRLLLRKTFDKNYILVEQAVYDWRKDKVNTQVVKLNVASGRNSIYRNLQIGRGNYILDNSRKIRLAVQYKGFKDTRLHYYDKKNKWVNQKIDDLFKGFTSISPIGFNDENSVLYFAAEESGAPRGLYKFKVPQDGKPHSLTKVFADPDSEIIDYKWDLDLKKLLYVDYGLAFPKRKYLSNNKFTRFLKEIDKVFPGEIITPVQVTNEDILFTAQSDVRPTTYYLYNKHKKEIKAFLSTNDKVNTKKTVKTQPVKIKVRDGENIHGFLYRPKDANKPTPLLVHIHGGPFGVKERWGFDGYDQFFAQKGYASLKLNYRGSGSRGDTFIDKGREVIGTKMQYDIIDSVKWAIKNKLADPKNICLWGVSYGGYSSVMTFLMRQDLFNCALGAGGVYNMDSITKMGDMKHSEYAQDSWADKLPKTKAERIAHSPVSLVNNLKKPLFIIHGKEDVRVPVAQARELKKKLKRAKKKFQYKEYKGVGHWFVDNKKRYDFFERALKFFNENQKTK